MSQDNIVSVVSALLTLAGVIVTVIYGNKKARIEVDAKQQIFNVKLENQLTSSNQLMMQKVDTLAEEVREHNNYARRMPVVEQKVEDLTRRVTVIEKKG